MSTQNYKDRMSELFGKLEGDSADGDPAYQAGADEINTPIDTGPDMDDEVADSLSTESEDIHEGSTSTTAYYKRKMNDLFGKLESDDETGGGDSAVDDPAYNAGADKINTPIDTGPDMDDEVADSLSTESEDVHEGSTATTAQYREEMKKLFGSLDDAFAGNESFFPNGTEALKTIRDVFLKQFTALRRFYQSLTQKGDGAIARLQTAKNKIAKMRSLPDDTFRGFSPVAAEAWMKADPAKRINNALKALADLQQASFAETISDQYDDIAAKLEQDIEIVEGAEPRKARVAGSDFKPAQIIKMIDFCLDLSRVIAAANTTYNGWWETGFNQGKLPAIFGGILVPFDMHLTTHRNVFRIARTGWRNINTTSAIAFDFINGVANFCDEIVESE